MKTNDTVAVIHPSITKALLVQSVDGSLIPTEVSIENIIEAFGVRGFEMTGVNNNHRNRVEIQGAPIFSKLCGPMYGGPGVIRYECAAANERLSC